jgi:hypothetical protein
MRLPVRKADFFAGWRQQVLRSSPVSPWPFRRHWLIDAARGLILRGAGWPELWSHAVIPWLMGLVMFALAMLKFRKRLS